MNEAPCDSLHCFSCWENRDVWSTTQGATQRPWGNWILAIWNALCLHSELSEIAVLGKTKVLLDVLMPTFQMHPNAWYNKMMQQDYTRYEYLQVSLDWWLRWPHPQLRFLLQKEKLHQLGKAMQHDATWKKYATDCNSIFFALFVSVAG
jgi:hypothetical protein